MKILNIFLKCTECGFQVSKMLETNTDGYFEIPNAFCPNDLCLLSVSVSVSLELVKLL